MNIILFGFTGLGSSALRALLKINGVNVRSVFTKKYFEPYPYYKEEQVEDICIANGIECNIGKKVNAAESVRLIKDHDPDLIIVSSFNQFISNEVISLPKLGIINVHPSLLPLYRGPYPEQWILLNEEAKTGVTFHYLTDKLDSGNILLQNEIIVEDSDDNCKLKKKSALMIEEMMPGLISLFKNNSRPEGKTQDEKLATFYPKPAPEDGHLEKENDPRKIKNKIRALNPFPGTSYQINGNRFMTEKYELRSSEYNKDGAYLSESGYIDVQKGSQVIRLFIKN